MLKLRSYLFSLEEYCKPKKNILYTHFLIWPTLRYELSFLFWKGPNVSALLCQSICLSILLFIYLHTYLFIYLKYILFRDPMCAVFPSEVSCSIPNVGAAGGFQVDPPSIRPSIHLSIYLSIYLYIYLYIYLSNVGAAEGLQLHVYQLFFSITY